MKLPDNFLTNCFKALVGTSYIYKITDAYEKSDLNGIRLALEESTEDPELFDKEKSIMGLKVIKEEKRASLYLRTNLYNEFMNKYTEFLDEREQMSVN